jgi:hypothetical protein
MCVTDVMSKTLSSKSDYTHTYAHVCKQGQRKSSLKF